MLNEKATIFDIALKLFGIWRTAPGIAAIAAKACQWANARFALMRYYVISIIGVFLGAILIHKAWWIQFCAKLAEHGLEAAHIAVGLDHRPADCIRQSVGLTNRAVKQADAIMAL